MLIVPDADILSAEVKVGPQEIDLLFPGSRRCCGFHAFHQQTTPELNGEVRRSRQIFHDQKTGANYYTIPSKY